MTLNVVPKPFFCESDGDFSEPQNEIIDLRCDSRLKNKFHEVSLLEFYRKSVEKKGGGGITSLRMYATRI